MSAIKDGGSAFPLATVGYSTDGMTLRDWFATHASETDIEDYREIFIADDGHPEWKRSREAARFAYADAMIKAREVAP